MLTCADLCYHEISNTAGIRSQLGWTTSWRNVHAGMVQASLLVSPSVPEIVCAATLKI